MPKELFMLRLTIALGLVLACGPSPTEPQRMEKPPKPLTATTSSCVRTVNVSTASGLRSAIANQMPGDCINVAAGTYSMGGQNLYISRSGSATRPIVIRGAGWDHTIFTLGPPANIKFSADYVYLRKLRITNTGVMGVWMEGAHHNVFDSIQVDHTQQQIIALKDQSYHNVIKNSRFHDSGLKWPQYGEAFYVGGKTPTLMVSRNVFRNQILNNRIGPNVRSQAVDIKGGADSTVVQNNFVDGTGTLSLPDHGSVTLISVASAYNIIDNNYLQYGNPDGITFYYQGQKMTGNLVTNNNVDLRNIHNFTSRLFFAYYFTSGTTGTGQVIFKCSNQAINGRYSNKKCET